ncbi:hypothetical protein SNEBB_008263 [Seison nebaliae]|nr:hypothetical protein SNEBB_008263 [Seison nebaliae]
MKMKIFIFLLHTLTLIRLSESKKYFRSDEYEIICYDDDVEDERSIDKHFQYQFKNLTKDFCTQLCVGFPYAVYKDGVNCQCRTKIDENKVHNSSSCYLLNCGEEECELKRLNSELLLLNGPFDECLLYGCSGNGICAIRHQAGRYECHCVNGFNGNRCEWKNTNSSCSSFPCQSGGLCIDGTSHSLKFQLMNSIELPLNELLKNVEHLNESTLNIDERLTHLINYGQPPDNLETSFTFDYDSRDKSIILHLEIFNQKLSLTIQPNNDHHWCLCREESFGNRCQHLKRSNGRVVAAKDTPILYDYCLSDPCTRGSACILQSYTYYCVCRPGKSGIHCEFELNNCVTLSCRNGGTCLSTPNGHQCKCLPTYTGLFCESKISSCAQYSPCSNGGICIDSSTGPRCLCPPNTSEKNCQLKNDNDCRINHCMNGGICVFHTNYGYFCSCPINFHGFSCEFTSSYCSPSPCRNGGRCVLTSGGFFCLCSSGCWGDLCENQNDETKCSINLCNSHGLINSNGICQCTEGYSGAQCTIPPNPCIRNSCLNGVCNPIQDAYWCQCSPNFSGFSCDAPVQNCLVTPCSNGGTCIMTSSGYICQCKSTFTGLSCEARVQYCLSKPCLNGGTCNENFFGYNCICPSNFVGRLCDTAIGNKCTNNYCFNGGSCIESDNKILCSCFPNFTGVRCENVINSCLPTTCLNGGTCNFVNGQVQCTCMVPFFGNNCEISGTTNVCSSNPCVNDGICTEIGNTYNCQCKPEFGGTNCEVDLCKNLFCQNGGTCKVVNNMASCHCAAPFTGVVCEVNGDNCASNPCQNGGQCTSNTFGYSCNCLFGFSGINCGISPNACSSVPCLNGGICTNTANGYYCQCTNGYSGVNCGNSPCASNPCLNGAFCSMNGFGYQCQCVNGYFGVTCANSPCASNPCLNNGMCNLNQFGYQCQCINGYTGINCANSPCTSNPCLNNGMCNLNQFGYQCQCINGYTGINCENSPCTSNPCLNGGICQMNLFGYQCQCINGYSGVNCEQFNGNQDCTSNPCMNGGTCRNVNGGYVCDCLAGYIGTDCQTPGTLSCSSNPCLNNGRCDEMGLQYVCQCVNGFTGINCEIPLSVCNSFPCLNGGQCGPSGNGYICQCVNGYTGINCEVSACQSNPCQNNGNCNLMQFGYQCSCESGFYGINCEMSSCDSNPCFNGGTCRITVTGYICDCLSGYTGIHCNDAQNACLSNPCMNSGRCDSVGTNYICQCTPTFTGTNCELSINLPCASSPCQNGAVCSSTPFNTYLCQCVNNYSGTNCDIAPSNCASNPCLNGGTCLPNFAGYICQCPINFTGASCETPYNICSSQPCLNGGTCTINISGQIVCKCVSPFIGVTCSIFGESCTPNPCQNDGVCSINNNFLQCKCKAPFYGNLCDITPCTSVPCMNNGICKLSDTGYLCQCIDSYTGVQCNISPPCNSNPCFNGGICTNVGGIFECLCVNGYFGETCSQISNTPCPTNICLNGGTCTITNNINTCHCLPTHTGNICETIICVVGYCANGGLCSISNNKLSCLCVGPYTGDTCSELKADACQPNSCANSGTCLPNLQGFTCICPIGFTGQFCRVTDECATFNCLNGGSCNTDTGLPKCICTFGFTGADCSIPLNVPCNSSPCLNQGVCSNVGNTYECQCISGFVGNNCEHSPNSPCSSSPCIEPGVCVSTLNGFTCQCPQGTTGGICQYADTCSLDFCFNGGTCKLNPNFLGVPNPVCTCLPEFTGRRCELKLDESDGCNNVRCMNNAKCTNVNNQITCICESPFSGDICELCVRKTKDDCNIVRKCPTTTCDMDEICIQNGIDLAVCYKTDPTVSTESTSSSTSNTINNITTTSTLTTTITTTTSSSTITLSTTTESIIIVENSTSTSTTDSTSDEVTVTKVTDTSANPCVSNPCKNGAECKEENNGYKCDCVKSNSFGPNCVAFIPKFFVEIPNKNEIQVKNDNSPPDLEYISTLENSCDEDVVVNGAETVQTNQLACLNQLYVKYKHKEDDQFKWDNKTVSFCKGNIDFDASKSKTTTNKDATSSLNYVMEIKESFPKNEFDSCLKDVYVIDDTNGDSKEHRSVIDSNTLVRDYPKIFFSPTKILTTKLVLNNNVTILSDPSQFILSNPLKPPILSDQKYENDKLQLTLNSSYELDDNESDDMLQNKIELTPVNSNEITQNITSSIRYPSITFDDLPSLTTYTMTGSTIQTDPNDNTKVSSPANYGQFTTGLRRPAIPLLNRIDNEVGLAVSVPKYPDENKIDRYIVKVNEFDQNNKMTNNFSQIFTPNEYDNYDLIKLGNSYGNMNISRDKTYNVVVQVEKGAQHAESLQAISTPLTSGNGGVVGSGLTPGEIAAAVVGGLLGLLLLLLLCACCYRYCCEKSIQPVKMKTYQNENASIDERVLVQNKTYDSTESYSSHYHHIPIIHKNLEVTNIDETAAANNFHNVKDVSSSYAIRDSINDVMMNKTSINFRVKNDDSINEYEPHGRNFTEEEEETISHQVSQFTTNFHPNIINSYMLSSDNNSQMNAVQSSQPIYTVQGINSQNYPINRAPTLNDLQRYDDSVATSLSTTTSDDDSKLKKLINVTYKVSKDDLQKKLDDENVDKIYKEFHNLEETDRIDKWKNSCRTATLQKNLNKNIYKHILPYDFSRVRLNLDTANVNHVNSNDYINASYIDGYQTPNQYIATQMPIEETIHDFWRLVWQYKITRIVMLNEIDEKSIFIKYWPDLNHTMSFGDNIVVKKTSETKLAHFRMSNFIIEKQGKERREVNHFHFISWPINSVPNSAHLLLFMRYVDLFDPSSTIPLLVHCNDGAGRTGTFITINSLLQEGQWEQSVNPQAYVQTIRDQRRGMVKTQEQYRFIYQTLLEGIICDHPTNYHVSQFPLITQKKLAAAQYAIKETPLKAEFWTLKSLGRREDEFYVTGEKKMNEKKNREKHIIAADWTRPRLHIDQNGNDYINAVYVNGVTNQGQFICTQLPLKETMKDYLSLLILHKIRLFITIDNGMKSTIEPFHNIFPKTKGSTSKLNGFKITNIETSDILNNGSLIYQKFNLSSSKSSQRQIEHLQLTRITQEKQSLIALCRCLSHVREHINCNGKGSIIVQDLNGNELSGLFILLYNALDRMQYTNTIDIFQETRLIRIHRPSFIGNLPLYVQAHKILMHLTSSDDFGHGFNIGRTHL